MSSLTNVWIPDQQKEPFRKACEHYRFDSMAAFFRICATTLIEHHAHKDILNQPITLEHTKKVK